MPDLAALHHAALTVSDVALRAILIVAVADRLDMASAGDAHWSPHGDSCDGPFVDVAPS